MPGLWMIFSTKGWLALMGTVSYERLASQFTTCICAPKPAILSRICCLNPVRIATARIITASPSAMPIMAITLIGREKAVSWLRSLISRRAMNVPVDITAKLRINSPRVHLQRLCKRLHCEAQVVDLKDIGHPYLILAGTRSEIKPGCRCYHDSLVIVAEILQQPLGEPVGVIYGKPDHSVKCSLGQGAINARHAVQSFYHEIPARYIFIVYLVEVFFGRSDGCFGRNLSQPRRTKARLSEFECSSEHLLVTCYQRTDAHPAHTVTLGNRVKQYNILINTFELHGREVFLAVAELPVNLIRQEEEIMFLYYITQLHQLITRIYRTCGVIGIAY